jgi:hypothetical protein
MQFFCDIVQSPPQLEYLSLVGNGRCPGRGKGENYNASATTYAWHKDWKRTSELNGKVKGRVSKWDSALF